MKSLSSARMSVFPVLAALFVTACSAPDNTLAPTVAAVAPPQHYQSYDGSVLTLVDRDDGTSYTLDVNAGEIRFSDGRVLLLDFDQTTEALATFHGTIVADSVQAELDTFYGNCEDPKQVICDSSAETLSAQTSGTPPLMWRFIDVSKPKKNKDAKNKDGKKNKDGTQDAVTTQASSDVCSDVATAAITASGAFSAKRTSIWPKVFGYGVAEAYNWLTRRLPPGTTAAYEFGRDVADHLYTRTNVSVLAFTWNSYGCSSRTVIAGPIIRNSGSGGVGRILKCETQLLEISFDGGNTWHQVWARVCQYQSA